MSFCGNCGQKNDDGSKFCFHCGSPLAEEPSPVEAPVNIPGVDYTHEIPSAEKIEEPGAVGGNGVTDITEGADIHEIPPEVYPPNDEGAYQPPVKKKNSKTPIIIAAAVVVILAVVAAVLILTHTICLFHEYSEPTCEEAATCVYCEKEGDSALGHAWTDATCEVPKTCIRCQKTEGDKLPHIWKDATCVAPKFCENCSIAEGEALGHEWQGGSCTEPGRCVRCGIEGDEPAGHIDGEWVVDTEATLVKGGSESLLCAECDEVIDTRMTIAKDPAVNGTAFNFTEAEFVEWLEVYLGFSIIDSSAGEVYSFVTSAGGYKGDIAVECDETGNVYAIGILMDDATTTITTAMGLASNINPVFYYGEDDIAAVYEDGYYTDALLTVAYDDSDGFCIAVIAPEAWFNE